MNSSISERSISEGNAAPGFGRRWFLAYTLIAALAVWLGLTLAEGRAQQGCSQDGLLFQWSTWTCVPAGGTIILPSELKRA